MSLFLFGKNSQSKKFLIHHKSNGMKKLLWQERSPSSLWLSQNFCNQFLKNSERSRTQISWLYLSIHLRTRSMPIDLGTDRQDEGGTTLNCRISRWPRQVGQTRRTDVRERPTARARWMRLSFLSWASNLIEKTVLTEKPYIYSF